MSEPRDRDSSMQSRAPVAFSMDLSKSRAAAVASICFMAMTIIGLTTRSHGASLSDVAAMKSSKPMPVSSSSMNSSREIDLSPLSFFLAPPTDRPRTFANVLSLFATKFRRMHSRTAPLRGADDPASSIRMFAYFRWMGIVPVMTVTASFQRAASSERSPQKNAAPASGTLRPVFLTRAPQWPSNLHRMGGHSAGSRRNGCDLERARESWQRCNARTVATRSEDRKADRRTLAGRDSRPRRRGL